MIMQVMSALGIEKMFRAKSLDYREGDIGIMNVVSAGTETVVDI